MNELKEIEVDEVSLVDRPATGKRFVLFKRAGFLRRLREENKNICSQIPEHDISELAKRADDAEARLRRLSEQAERLEQRLNAVEKAHPGRQSEETAPARGGLWDGVL